MYMYMYYDCPLCISPSHAGHRTIFVLTKVDLAEKSGIKQDRVRSNHSNAYRVSNTMHKNTIIKKIFAEFLYMCV